MNKLFVFLIYFFMHSLFANPIHVLTFDETRVGTSTNANGSINFNFAVGNGYSTIRNSLLSSSNFGTSGIVKRSVNILPGVPELTMQNLVGVDVVILPVANLSDSEKQVLQNFVFQGGGLIAFNNEAALTFADMFGATAINNGTANATVINAATSPLVSNVFGSVSGSITTGYAKAFTNLGSQGIASLQNSLGYLSASFTLGLGHAAIFADEEIFLNAPGVSGIASACLSATTHTMFLNSFAYVAPEENFIFIPEPSSILMFSVVIALTVLGSVRS